jgi:cobalt-zinc-cadmium efflux system protein
MAHSHEHSSHKNIASALALNLFFVVLEIIGGLLTNSFAILSDALHDFGDTMSLGVAWYLERVSKRSKTSTFSFGYRRFSLLSALINNLVLLIGSTFILWQVIPKLSDPHHSNGAGMLVLAVFGIAINGFAAFKLRKGKSMNEKSVSLHMLEDLYGWVVVLAAGLLIMIKDIHVIDPLLSIGITLYILLNVLKSLRDTIKIFLQGVPTDLKIGEIAKDILGVKGVEGLYDMNLWSLDGEHNVFSAHVGVESGVKGEKLFSVKNEVKHKVFEHEIDHLTIELERSNERTKQERIDGLKDIKRMQREEITAKDPRTFMPKSKKARAALVLIILSLFVTAFVITPESNDAEQATHEHEEGLR